MKPTSPSAAYRVELVVQNAKSFKGRHVLDLRDRQGSPSRWTLILGENGVGKTTLLQCIAATAPHKNAKKTPEEESADTPERKQKFFLEAVGVIDDSVVDLLARDGSVEFEISSTYAKNVRLADGQGRKPKTFTVGIQFSRTQDQESFVQLDADEANVVEPLVLSYGAGRKMGVGNIEAEPAETMMGTLFRDERALVDADELIQQLDYSAVKRRTKLAKQQRDTFLEMLASLLPDVHSAKDFVIHAPSPVGRRKKTGVYVRVPYGEVQLRQLSFGYQTMTGWLADIAWQLFRHYPDSVRPLREPAIVLVDEIDLHLHPRWQRELQDLLAAHFPAVQFVATAHSPLMAQAVSGLNLAVVLRDDDTVRIHNDPTVVANWRIDQVVASELFGLTPWGPEVQKKLEEQSRLLKKPRRTAEDNRNLVELDQFVQALPTGLPSKMEEAMDVISRAASSLVHPKT